MNWGFGKMISYDTKLYERQCICNHNNAVIPFECNSPIYIFQYDSIDFVIYILNFSNIKNICLH